MNCPNCESSNSIKRGFNKLANGLVKQRFKCKDCSTNYMVDLPDTFVEDVLQDDFFVAPLESFIRNDVWLSENIYNKNRFVVTSAQNNTFVDKEFLNLVKLYCCVNSARLIVIPVKYRTINSSESEESVWYDESIKEYLVENVLEWEKYNLKMYCGMKIQATAENPLSGMEPLSKGYSVVFGHAQVQLKTMPTLDRIGAKILTTTGSITQKNYSNTKLGEKARFNHSMSALVVELDKNSYHLRHLNYDSEKLCFYDLDKKYFDGKVTTESIEAIVTGDEHALFRDEKVERFTYTSPTSMINVLKPKTIYRGDVLDAYSISHHHKKNVFTQYAKFKNGSNDILAEVKETIEYINKTTPLGSTSVIVESNHNEHLTRWLNEIDIRTEPWNALVYHYLMYTILSETEMTPYGASHPNPFEVISRKFIAENVRFIDRTGEKVLGIEVGQHGDKGINGARGGAKGFAKMPEKMVVGHSHAPSIEKGCYTVGTSSRLKLEYVSGASTWHHAHVIIHKNGKRQMIFITDDGWSLV